MSFQEQLEDKTRLNDNLEKQLSQRYVFQKKSEKKKNIGHVFLKHPCTESSVCLSVYLSNQLTDFYAFCPTIPGIWDCKFSFFKFLYISITFVP